MKVFIANFGIGNVLWESCRMSSTLATLEDEDTWPYWLANDREGYVARCVATKKTSAGITPTRPVASRWFGNGYKLALTEGDLWIHREKNELWWAVSQPGKFSLELVSTPSPGKTTDQVYIMRKRVDGWSNKTRKGGRLEWPGLHAKAQDFLFTDGTLQMLSEDNALYAQALVAGEDLRLWHSRADWTAKAKEVGRNPVISYPPREVSIMDMAKTARETAAAANGQQALRTVKNKEVRFEGEKFERYIGRLLEAQEGLCAVTGLQLQFYGAHDDRELLCSLDRIDSDGHYEEKNLQIVCRFINRWKNNENDATFRRLIDLVRSTDGFG